MTSDSPPQPVPRNYRRTRRWMLAIALLAAVWILGDFGYSRYVQREIKLWEASIPWTAEGLAPDAEEFSVGQGSIGLLMVHGFSDSPQMYRKLAPALAERGYACRAILLPGFGRDVQSYAETRVDRWLEKVQIEAEALKEKHSKVVIVAHSLGGAITINHILENPQTADALVLIAPAIEVSNQRSPLFPTRFWHEFGKIALPSTTITASPFEMDAHDPAERDRPTRNRFGPRSVVDNTFRLIDANRGRAQELRVPTLVFLSTTDQVVDSAAIETFYEQCGSEQKQLVKLADSGHMIPVDRQWEQVVEEIDQFVRTSLSQLAN